MFVWAILVGIYHLAGVYYDDYLGICKGVYVTRTQKDLQSVMRKETAVS